MKYYIIAGEASGDLHGSNLMQALQHQDSNTSFRFWGGDLMAAYGGEPVKHIKDLAFMGFVEVVANLRTILTNIKLCKSDLLKFQPDALILIDYPGFNMRIAEFAKANGIPVHYYISPQVWAWKQNRVHKLKKTVDFMYCILPFEKDFYKKFEMEVDYVGHPLVDAIQKFRSAASLETDFRKKHNLSERPILALLPGSRLQEIKKKLPLMLGAANAFSDMEIVIAAAPNIEAKVYLDIAKNIPIQIIPNQAYEVLNNAYAAMVTSGTATLETALFHVPQVVCYKGNPISVAIARRLVKIDYISLVNLIMNKEVVKELIQSELTEKNIIEHLGPLIETSKKREILLTAYNELEAILGGGGASEKVAGLIFERTKQ